MSGDRELETPGQPSSKGTHDSFYTVNRKSKVITLGVFMRTIPRIPIIFFFLGTFEFSREIDKRPLIFGVV